MYKKIVFIIINILFIFCLASCEENNHTKKTFPKKKEMTYNIGDSIIFGNYEQDNDTSNGKEDVEWIVLDKKDNSLLIISKYGLDARAYNAECEGTPWYTCDLRNWLNNDFIHSAFNTEERRKIETVTLPAQDLSAYTVVPNEETQDKIFLLSVEEAHKYFDSDESRKCIPTEYAIANGAYRQDGINSWWWLRTTGGRSLFYIANVYCDGAIGDFGLNVDYSGCAIRPAMWINNL